MTLKTSPCFGTSIRSKPKPPSAYSPTTSCEQSIWLAPRVLGPVSPEPHKKEGSPEPLVSTQPARAELAAQHVELMAKTRISASRLAISAIGGGRQTRFTEYDHVLEPV